VQRFTSVDPLAEIYYSISPYAYCKNNPVNYIDPNGEFSTKFGAWLHKIFHGGGSKIEKNSNGQYYYTKGLEGEAGVAAVYGSNGVKGKPDQLNGASIFGTASSQLIKLGTSIYHEASIDMKEASNDAIDLWAKILKNNSASTNQNGNSKILNSKVTGKKVIKVGIVYKVVDGEYPYVYWKDEKGVVRYFNSKNYQEKDTIYKTEAIDYDNGKTDTTYTNYAH